MPEYEEIDDLRVINRVLTGDTEAFSILVAKYQSEILSFARMYLRDPDDAEEAAQEAFIKVFKSLSTFDLSRRFKPWLFSVASNAIRSYRSKRIRFRRDADIAARQPGAQYPGPEEAMDSKQRVQAVRDAVRQLPKKPREAAILYYIQGLSVSETAESLGIGEENVKSRLHRARKLLKISLIDHATD